MTTPRISNRLREARRRRFVGRNTERALFESALKSLTTKSSASPEIQLLHIFGPGGVGKTALITEFIDLCQGVRVTAIHLDARNIEPSPDSFLESLRVALNAEAALPALVASSTPYAIFVDTYEILAPLDNWLCETFLPQLPENVLTVLAGRNPPSMVWRADPGWQTLIRTIALRNLAPDETRDYLERQNIPADQHKAVLEFTHGHPLALSLLSDVFAQRPESLRNFQLECAPDVVKTLLERLVQKVPGPAHHAALEACALVRLTTESLLAEMLGTQDASELFDWLRNLTFIEYGPNGLFPHDLTREALVADLRWRNPDWYTELHKRARNYYAKHLQQSSGAMQQRILLDYVFLHRDNPMVRPFVEWQTSGSMLAEPARESDVPTLVEMVRAHEGDESAQLAAHWFSRQPQNLLVFRDPEGNPAGFLFMLALQQAGEDDLARDPAAKAAVQYLRGHAPLRPGEVGTLFRFWLARDTYQSVSPVQSVIFINMVRHYLATPGLVFTFVPCADPGFWAPMFAYADLARLPDADYAVGGRRYGIYGHNWRATPPMAWLALLADRETGVAQPEPPQAPPPLVVLSEQEFADAVQDALHDLTRRERLDNSPLLRSRLVIEASGQGDRATALQKLIKDAAESLQASPRDTKFYRALYHTYLQPAPSQEQAAELLDLPFSTFRRHLKSGADRVVEILWRQELQGLI